MFCKMCSFGSFYIHYLYVRFIPTVIKIIYTFLYAITYNKLIFTVAKTCFSFVHEPLFY